MIVMQTFLKVSLVSMLIATGACTVGEDLDTDEDAELTGEARNGYNYNGCLPSETVRACMASKPHIRMKHACLYRMRAPRALFRITAALRVEGFATAEDRLEAEALFLPDLSGGMAGYPNDPDRRKRQTVSASEAATIAALPLAEACSKWGWQTPLGSAAYWGTVLPTHLGCARAGGRWQNNLCVGQ